jgi:hypothetical protein
LTFYGSEEVEKRLLSEVELLKGELVAKQTELDAVSQGQQVTEATLQAQIVESEKRKEDALAALKDASEKSDVFKKNCDGT